MKWKPDVSTTMKTFDYLLIICIQWISDLEELVMSMRDMIEGWVRVESKKNLHMHNQSQFDKTSVVFTED